LKATNTDIVIGKYLIESLRFRNLTKTINVYLHKYAPRASSHLSNALQAAGKLQLIDTLMHGFSIRGTFWHWPFSSTATNANTIDDKTWSLKERNTQRHASRRISFKTL